MSDRLPLELDAAQMNSLTCRVSEFVIERVATLGEQPASDLAGAESVAAALCESAPERGRPLGELLDRLAPAIAKSHNGAGPGYLAYIPGGGIFTSALADFLAGAGNRYTGVRQAAPALVALEETVIAWLAEAMGYPKAASGIPTTGGSIASLAAIVTARSAHLDDDPAGGALYASEEVHHSVLRAVRIAGFAPEQVRALPVDERYRLRPEALARAVREDRARPAPVPGRGECRHHQHRRGGPATGADRDRAPRAALGPRRRRIRRLLPARPFRGGADAGHRGMRLELLDEPQLSVLALSHRAGDAASEELLRRVNARRRVFLSSTRLGGRFALRLCVLSFRTHRDRVQEAVEALGEEGRALA